MRFVRDFSTVAAPLIEISKKNVGFKWEKKKEHAFVALKEKLTHAPILHYLIMANPLKLSVMRLGLG